jgi:hypothetical protein
MRTLDIFVSTLVETSGGRLPENFVVTLPKITIPEQVSALADLFDFTRKADRSGRRLSTARYDDRNYTVDYHSLQSSERRTRCEIHSPVVEYVELL